MINNKTERLVAILQNLLDDLARLNQPKAMMVLVHTLFDVERAVFPSLFADSLDSLEEFAYLPKYDIMRARMAVQTYAKAFQAAQHDCFLDATTLRNESNQWLAAIGTPNNV